MLGNMDYWHDKFLHVRQYLEGKLDIECHCGVWCIGKLVMCFLVIWSTRVGWYWSGENQGQIQIRPFIYRIL